MRIAFLAVNASYSHSSLAAWCLQGCLPPGWEWSAVEVTVKEASQPVVEQLAAGNPRVVAATLYLFNRDKVLEILGRVRELCPGCVIVVGGPECLGDNQPLLAPAGMADVAVRGEGERAFPKWLQRVAGAGRWADIPGLCWRDEAGYHDNGMAEVASDLDAIPGFYAERLRGFSKPFVQLETTRGCGNGCLFCTSRKTTVRQRSVARVRSDLAAIARAGVREVRIVDRTFNEDQERAVALTRLFRGEFPGLRVHLEIDPARLGNALAAELAAAPAGQFHVEAGVQSLDPAVYEVIGREATIGRTVEGLRRLCGLRTVAVHVDLIAGLPGGTWRSLIDDLATIIALAPDEIQLERLKLLPGTPLARTPEQWGLKAEARTPYAVVVTRKMLPADLERADRVSKLVDWFYNEATLRDLVVGVVTAEPGFMERFERRMEQEGMASVCPNLEDRFLMLDRSVTGEWRERLRYRWYRLGFSGRRGPCKAVPWKGAIPGEAELVEGDAGARVTRIWRVALGVPHYFCQGVSPAGVRTVVTVYREKTSLTRERDACPDGPP